MRLCLRERAYMHCYLVFGRERRIYYCTPCLILIHLYSLCPPSLTNEGKSARRTTSQSPARHSQNIIQNIPTHSSPSVGYTSPPIRPLTPQSKFRRPSHLASLYTRKNMPVEAAACELRLSPNLLR